MKTDNELIARFMGFKKKVDDDGRITWSDVNENIKDSRNRFLPSDLRFHDEWDWLMPVVLRIRELYSDHIDEIEWVNSIERVTELPVKSDIRTVYEAVVTFITWYNAQSQNKNIGCLNNTIGTTVNMDQRGHATLTPEQHG